MVSVLEGKEKNRKERRDKESRKPRPIDKSKLPKAWQQGGRSTLKRPWTWRYTVFRLYKQEPGKKLKMSYQGVRNRLSEGH